MIAPAADRARLIKLIHVAKRDLGLDEPTYRTMLRTAGKAESTTAMGVPALMRVLEQAKKAGFKVRHKTADRRQDTRPEARKVRALWLFLHALGAVRDPSEAALAAYVKRIAKVDDLHWADGLDMLKLIETLKQWALRFLPERLAALRVECMQLLQTTQITQLRHGWIRIAMDAMSGEPTFDLSWTAWEYFMGALGRTVDSDMQTEFKTA